MPGLDPARRLAALTDDQLENLDRTLAIASSRLTEPQLRAVRGEAGVTSNAELRAVRQEILESARRGVEIASQAESRPLVPLFAAAKAVLPAEIQVDHEQMGYDFYLVEVTFSSLLPPEQYLLKAELGLKLSDDVQEPARRTRPVRLFPGRKDLNLFSVDLEGAVGLDAGMNFSIPMAGNQLLAFGKLTADAKLKANLVAGPFHFQFRRAAIEVKGESDQLILWRYNLQSELRGTNDFKSVLVLKVSREARAVSLGVTLGVTRCQRRWLMFREHLPQLTDTQVLPVELVKP